MAGPAGTRILLQKLFALEAEELRDARHLGRANLNKPIAFAAMAAAIALEFLLDGLLHDLGRDAGDFGIWQIHHKEIPDSQSIGRKPKP